MLIIKLKEHFPARISEWFNGVILTSWGLYLLLHPDLFSSPAMRVITKGMNDMVPFGYNAESVWGLVAFTAGLIRLVALFINGAWSRTPALRMLTAAISAFVWTQVVIGLMTVPNTGLAVYPWLVVIDIVAAYRAGRDVAISEVAQRKLQLGAFRDQYDRSHAVA